MTQPDTSSAPEKCPKCGAEGMTEAERLKGMCYDCQRAASRETELRDQLAQRTVELAKCETAYHEQADRADAERVAREKAEAEAKRLGGHISDAVAQVETWRERAKKAEAEVERLVVERDGARTLILAMRNMEATDAQTADFDVWRERKTKLNLAERAFSASLVRPVEVAKEKKQ